MARRKSYYDIRRQASELEERAKEGYSENKRNAELYAGLSDNLKADPRVREWGENATKAYEEQKKRIERIKEIGGRYLRNIRKTKDYRKVDKAEARHLQWMSDNGASERDILAAAANTVPYEDVRSRKRNQSTYMNGSSANSVG